jgi:RNA polymerase sigma-70 factor (ECF subfamily)
LEIELQNSHNYIVDILKREGNTILRLAFSYLKNMTDAEDVYQEVFLKLVEGEFTFESEEHEKAWLIRVTINLCKNRLRSFWRNKVGSLNEDMIAKYEDISNGIDILNAVMSLKLKHRTVIHLFYYEDYTTYVFVLLF